MMMGWLQGVLDLFIPDRCHLCGQVHSDLLNEWFSAGPLAREVSRPIPAGPPRLGLHSHPVCIACSGGLRECAASSELSDGTPLITPFFESPNLLAIIHALKFRRVATLARALGGATSTAVAAAARRRPELTSATLVPVAMDTRSVRARGFNQSALLADEIGRRLKMPVDHATLRRVRRGQRQSLTPLNEREANVRSAFAAIAGTGSLVLVDDLVTSGATALACISVLQRVGWKVTAVVAVGRGPLPALTGAQTAQEPGLLTPLPTRSYHTGNSVSSTL